MKQLIKILILLVSANVFSQNCIELSKGDTFKFADWQWVSYQNEVTQIWSNDVTTSKVGDLCGVDYGGGALSWGK